MSEDGFFRAAHHSHDIALRTHLRIGQKASSWMLGANSLWKINTQKYKYMGKCSDKCYQ